MKAINYQSIGPVGEHTYAHSQIHLHTIWCVSLFTSSHLSVFYCFSTSQRELLQMISADCVRTAAPPSRELLQCMQIALHRVSLHYRQLWMNMASSYICTLAALCMIVYVTFPLLCVKSHLHDEIFVTSRWIAGRKNTEKASASSTKNRFHLMSFVQIKEGQCRSNPFGLWKYCIIICCN